jgi:hypothetical protein
MRASCCTLLLTSAAAALVLMAPGSAHGAEAPPKPASLFSRVFPQASGKNGYEELVRAAELARSSKLFLKAEGGDATLAMKRAVLLERPIIQALALVKQGLGKPVFSPREKLDFTTVLPELAPLRSLGRLLGMQQYVLLADGRVSDALGVTHTLTRFGQVVQTDSVISGLVGIAIEAIGFRTIGGHLDQLSARDCETLFRLTTAWLAQPGPLPRLLETERRAARDILAQTRERGKQALEDVFTPDSSPDDQVKIRQLGGDLERARTGTSGDPDRLYSDAGKRIDEFYAHLHEQIRKPAWERSGLQSAGDGSLGDQILTLLAPAFEQVLDRYTRQRATIQLLACHSAIRRYRWEHNRLPATLAELNIGELAVDPFTGTPLQYEVRGSRYTLTSVGPKAAPDDPRAVDGRQPVNVVPE